MSSVSSFRQNPDMVKSKRFKPIAKFAQSRQDEAARLLGESQQALSAQEIRLADLKTYREEYVESYQNAGGRGMSIEQMRNYRSFLDNLDKAISQQEMMVQNAVADVHKDKDSWADKFSRRKVLDTVVDRFRQQEQKQLDRTEQRELDDRAAERKPG